MSATPSSQSALLRALDGQAGVPPPMWLMRQAGRYLPEYREVRAKVPSFLDLCLTPELAAEVTLQPLRRFPFDAAIVFSDILIVPYALGQKVQFVEGEGPKLEPVRDAAAIAKLDETGARERLAPVYETVARVVAELPKDVPLIGFCGAPWTVATYMVEGSGSKDQAGARALAYREPETFQRLIDILVEASARYLLDQVKAGCRVLQIFDSWAGSLPEDGFARWCIAPTKAIVDRVKAQSPDVPIIGFPRGGRAAGRALRCKKLAWTPLAATRASPWRGSASGCKAASPCKAISILCSLPWAGLRSRPASKRSWRPLAKALSSSTSAMASCRRRPSKTSSGWSAW